MRTTRRAELALTKGLSLGRSETHRIILESPSQLSRSGDRVGALSSNRDRIEIIANILSTLFIYFLPPSFSSSSERSARNRKPGIPRYSAGNLILERDTSDTSHVSFNGSKKKESSWPVYARYKMKHGESILQRCWRDCFLSLMISRNR